MVFDPEELPLADFGLACAGCGYPLARLTRMSCPECGRAVDLGEYIPEGAMPTLYSEGQPVRYTEAVAALLKLYAIPHVQMTDQAGLLPGLAVGGSRLAGPVAVARTHYFEAIDLLRRQKLGEPMPDPPPASGAIKGIDWACPACGEENPGHFEVCWNCGQENP